jgi:hypothetical protein
MTTLVRTEEEKRGCGCILPYLFSFSFSFLHPPSLLSYLHSLSFLYVLCGPFSAVVICSQSFSSSLKDLSVALKLRRAILGIILEPSRLFDVWIL